MTRPLNGLCVSTNRTWVEYETVRVGLAREGSVAGALTGILGIGLQEAAEDVAQFGGRVVLENKP